MWFEGLNLRLAYHCVFSVQVNFVLCPCQHTHAVICSSLPSSRLNTQHLDINYSIAVIEESVLKWCNYRMIKLVCYRVLLLIILKTF
jgi:hypothetical protein